jgi:hypothetical protein
LSGKKCRNCGDVLEQGNPQGKSDKSPTPRGMLRWTDAACLARPRHHHKDHGFGVAVFGATLVPDPSADAFVSFVTKHNKSGSDPAVSVFEDKHWTFPHVHVAPGS